MRRFNLLDGAYYAALLRASEAFEEHEIPFCLVGGGAAQAWIASLRTGAGERKLSDEPVLATALRKTRDLDFATRTDAATMLRVLNDLAAEARGPAHVLGPRSLRLGQVSISVTLEPNDLSGMAGLYDVFLSSARPLTLRRGASLDEVPTIGLAELIATKLTRRGDKAKDLLDVGQLMAALTEAGKALDFARVRELVGADLEALVLLDELERETLP